MTACLSPPPPLPGADSNAFLPGQQLLTASQQQVCVNTLGSPPYLPPPALLVPRSCINAASESCILASLWLMESVDSVHRSPATVCLNDYLRHLAAFSPEVGVEPGSPVLGHLACAGVSHLGWIHRAWQGAGLPPQTPHPTHPTHHHHTHTLNPARATPAPATPQAVLEITKDWRASFCRLRAGVVDAQMQLLQALDWRLRLDVDSGGCPGLDPVGAAAASYAFALPEA